MHSRFIIHTHTAQRDHIFTFTKAVGCINKANKLHVSKFSLTVIGEQITLVYLVSI
jgi:hypothetical protein